MTEASLCIFKSKACWHGTERTRLTSGENSWVCGINEVQAAGLLLLCRPELRFLLFQIKLKLLGIISIRSLLSLEDGIVKICGLPGERQTQGTVKELWIHLSCVFVKMPSVQSQLFSKKHL